MLLYLLLNTHPYQLLTLALFLFRRHFPYLVVWVSPKKPLLASSSPFLWVLVKPLSPLCLQHALSPETFLSSANYLWLSIVILHSIYSARLPAANTDLRDCHPEKSLSYAYLKRLLFLSDLDTALLLTSTLEMLHLKWFLGNQAEMLNCGWA